MCRLICTFVVSMTFKQVFSRCGSVEPQHNKTNKMTCVPSKDRSAWASTQSDHSSLSAWRNLGSLATHWAHSEDSDQTGWMPRLICVCWAHRSYCWFSHDEAQLWIVLKKADVTWLVITWLWLVLLYCPKEDLWLKLLEWPSVLHRKQILKIWTPEKIVVITLKFEQNGFTAE